MEYGFCEFYDKDKMPAMDVFFRTGNGKDVLGLRKMNVRISDMLFPECSTLMPNLAYFYYLNAIYHVLRRLQNGKEPSESDINRYEKLLSKLVIEHQKEGELRSRGFFNDAENRAYHWYKTSFKNLHFTEKDWKVQENLQPQLKYLKETHRYQFIEDFISGNMTKPVETEVIFEKLDGVEKMDFVRRILAYKDNKKFRICNSSYFANIVQDILGINQIRKNSEIFKEDYNDLYIYMKKKEKRELPLDLKREPLPCFFGLNYGKALLGDINMYENLKMAQTYSYLQGIAKKVYNYVLFERSRQKQDEVKKELKKWLGLKSNFEEYTWNWKSNQRKYFEPFCYDRSKSECDRELYDIYLFINDIQKMINISNEIGDDFTSSTWFENLCRFVAEREKKVMGNDAFLYSGFVTDKPYADYIDTFRWEYRPSDSVEEAGEDENTDVIESKNAFDVPHTMCARSFIYELFYEK